MNKDRLIEYINKDYSYINYKTGVEDGTDFDKFCIQHCKDIEELLEENRKLKEELEKIKQPTIFIDTQDMEERYGEQLYQDYLVEQNKDLQQRIDKATEYIKNKWYEKNTRNIEDMISLGDWRLDLLEILGGKE